MSSLTATTSFRTSSGKPSQAWKAATSSPSTPQLANQPPAGRRPPRRTHSSANTPTGLRRQRQTPPTGHADRRRPGRVRRPERNRDPAPGRDAQPRRRQRPRGLLRAADRLPRQRSKRPLLPGRSRTTALHNRRSALPEASKLGTVRIKTPLLEEELTGSVYLASPEPKPLRLADRPLHRRRKRNVSACASSSPAKAQLNEQTGQISTTFTDTPQVPFEDLKVKLFGGPRGSLTTPATCGHYTTSASFTPWSRTSAPSSVTLLRPATFNITSGAQRQPLRRTPSPSAPPSKRARKTSRPAPSRPSP